MDKNIEEFDSAISEIKRELDETDQSIIQEVDEIVQEIDNAIFSEDEREQIITKCNKESSTLQKIQEDIEFFLGEDYTCEDIDAFVASIHRFDTNDIKTNPVAFQYNTNIDHILQMIDGIQNTHHLSKWSTQVLSKGYDRALHSSRQKYSTLDVFLHTLSRIYLEDRGHQSWNLEDFFNNAKNLLNSTSNDKFVSLSKFLDQLTYSTIDEVINSLTRDSWKGLYCDLISDLSTEYGDFSDVIRVAFNSLLQDTSNLALSPFLVESPSLDVIRARYLDELYVVLTEFRRYTSKTQKQKIAYIPLILGSSHPTIWTNEEVFLHPKANKSTRMKLEQGILSRPLILQVAIDSTATKLEILQTMMLDENKWNMFKKLYETEGDISFSSAWKYIKSHLLLFPLTKEKAPTSKTPLSHWSPEFREAALLFSFFLKGNKKNSGPYLDVALRHLIHGSAEIPISCGIVQGKGRYYHISHNLQIDNSTNPFWVPYFVPFNRSSSSFNRIESALRGISAEFLQYARDNSPLIKWNLVRFGEDENSKTRKDKTHNQESNDVFESSYVEIEGTLDSIQDNKSILSYAEMLCKYLTNDIVELINSSPKDVIGRSRLAPSANPHGNDFIEYQERFLGRDAVVLSILDSIASVLEYFGVRIPEKGGLSGEKVVCVKSLNHATTKKTLTIKDTGVQMRITDSIEKNRPSTTTFSSQKERWQEIPFTHVEIVLDDGTTKSYPLLAVFAISNTAYKIIPYPELLWDIDNMLLEIGDKELLYKLNKLRNKADWSSASELIISFLTEHYIFSEKTTNLSQGFKNLILEIDPLRITKHIVNYNCIAKEALFTAQMRKYSEQGIPLTIDTSWFPHSIECLSGYLAQVFGGILCKRELENVADALEMFGEGELKFNIVAVFPSKNTGKDPNTTSADAWVLLWRQHQYDITDKRVLKIMYKAKTEQALFWSDFAELNSALSIEKHSESIPVLGVLDISSKSECGQLAIRRTTRLNQPHLDIERHTSMFDIWIRRISKWIDSSILLSGSTSISKDNLELKRKFTFCNDESFTVAHNLSSNITNLKERLHRTGFMYRQIEHFKEVLIQLDSKNR